MKNFNISYNRPPNILITTLNELHLFIGYGILPTLNVNKKLVTAFKATDGCRIKFIK